MSKYIGSQEEVANLQKIYDKYDIVLLPKRYKDGSFYGYNLQNLDFESFNQIIEDTYQKRGVTQDDMDPQYEPLSEHVYSQSTYNGEVFATLPIDWVNEQIDHDIESKKRGNIVDYELSDEFPDIQPPEKTDEEIDR